MKHRKSYIKKINGHLFFIQESDLLDREPYPSVVVNCIRHFKNECDIVNTGICTCVLTDKWKKLEYTASDVYKFKMFYEGWWRVEPPYYHLKNPWIHKAYLNYLVFWERISSILRYFFSFRSSFKLW